MQIKNTPIMLAAMFALGFAVGLFIFGWGLTPVRFMDGGPQHLSETDLKNYVAALADAYSSDGSITRVKGALCNWDRVEHEDGAAAAAITELADREADPAYQSRLRLIASVLQEGGGCAAFNAASAPAADEEGRSPFLTICGGLLLLLLAGLAVVYFLRQRQAPKPGAVESHGGGVAQGRIPELTPVDEPDSPPSPGFRPRPAVVPPPEPEPEPEPLDEIDIIPLAGFETTYVRGDDSYDKSFTIENASGDFLGECGVSVSEVLAGEGVRNITAFEIWLFDKNDTHTVTKVVMSEHAYHDGAMRAKLATRGEPLLAEVGEVIALETAALIINAEIKEIVYNPLHGPSHSIFERFSVHLSAWVKGDGTEAG